MRCRCWATRPLRTIAQELVETVRRNATIDWTVRESVRAGMRNAVRRVLRKHGYPPDKQDKAVETVIEQAELLSEEWARPPSSSAILNCWVKGFQLDALFCWVKGSA